jgi:hypothetical protein
MLRLAALLSPSTCASQPAAGHATVLWHMCSHMLPYQNTSSAHSADDHAPHSSFNHCPHAYLTTIPTQQIYARAPHAHSRAAQRPRPHRNQINGPIKGSTCCPKVCQASPAGAGSQQSRAWPGRVPYVYRYTTSCLHARDTRQQMEHAAIAVMRPPAASCS